MNTKLSVNINKIATIRNARGGSTPNLVQIAIDCQLFGADGITVHPRPDERHITKNDVFNLAPVVTTEFNIEGYPNNRFLKLVEEIKPTQATLVPDPPNVLTSNAGWNTIEQKEFLTDILLKLRNLGIRTSLFIEPNVELIKVAGEIGADRIEFYTGPYADNFETDKELAIQPFIIAAKVAHDSGLGINAGHDLNLNNLGYFKSKIENLEEVSIGHALISDALYFGLENTIQKYKNLLV